MKKRVISLLLALVMLLGLLPTAALASDAAGVAITMSASDAAYGFYFQPQSITVTDGLAEEYGYTVAAVDHNSKPIDGPTVFDALVAAHIQKYGDSFTTETASTYLDISGGMLRKAFGQPAVNSSFFLDGYFPNDGKGVGYVADTACLQSGDTLEWWLYADADTFYCMDYYTCFTERSKQVMVGAEFELTLTGFSPMSAMGAQMPANAPESEPVFSSEGEGLLTLNTVQADGSLSEAISGKTTDSNGKVSLSFSQPGTYLVTANGFCDGSGAAASLLDGGIPVILPWCEVTVVAPPDSQWPNFRGSDVNMAITSAETPKDAASAMLRWNAKLGSGWSAAPSVQIIVDDYLVVMSGTKIYKLDLETGETVATGEMSATPSYGYTPPTYASEEGFIIAPLGGGTLEAFNAVTLEKVWTFQDTLGGQALSPVTYSSGNLYTGFWNGETQKANFVCVDAATGELEWSYTVAGGFYWAGSVSVGNYIVVGTDDGASGSTGDSSLLVFQQTYGEGATAEPVASEKLTGLGDQRSSMAYADGRVYFTTKGGYLCSAAIDTDTGAISDLKFEKQASQSTSTPIVYNGHVYFCAGSGVVSGSGGAGNFIIANAETLQQEKAVALTAYPQASVLLSTAYESEGYLYFYTTYNGTPGGISLIKVKADDITDAELMQLYDAAGFEQYCIASIICDEDGNLYYKNDSGNVLSVGSNNAYLTALSADVGTGLEAFKSSTASYELVVPAGTKRVTLIAAAYGDGTVTINGGSDSRVTLADGVATASIQVTNGSDKRTYTVDIREASANAALSALQCNESNGYSSFKALSPEFNSGVYAYAWCNVSEGRNFVNVWPDAADTNATVKVYALSNVQDSCVNEDGSIDVTAKSSGHNRYAVYFADSTKPMRIRIEVTAEDGVTQNSYELGITKSSKYNPNKAEISVTIADKGAVVVPQKTVTITDADSDGKLTVSDALYAAHEEFYTGGAAAGYESYVHETYGLSIAKLWGDTSNNFGYYIDNAMAMGASDVVTSGQHLVAYVTANAYPNADAYAYFDSSAYTVKRATAQTVTLNYQSGYDEDWKPTFSSYDTATLTAYDSQLKALDAGAYTVRNSGGGKYAVTFANEGTYYVVATAENHAIVPALCVFTVEESGGTGSGSSSSSIKVSFRLIGAEKATQDVNLTDSSYLPEYVTWIATERYTLDAGSTVGDLFKLALDDAGLSYIGFASNYISTITAPASLGGYQLSEFTNGARSGWMYTVNGSHPNRGLNDWKLSDGDVVIWHYVNDYSHEVEDWFDDADYPALGDGTYYNGWLKAKDQNPGGSANVGEAASETEARFTDVKGHWALEAIRYVYGKGLMTGVSTTRFCPDSTLTRGMLVTILYRLDGKPVVTGGTFTDVAADAWYAEAVAWASEHKIVTGYGNGLFGPEDTITREQMAAMLYRFADYKGYDVTQANDLKSFRDADGISPWALGALQWANAEALVNGRTDTTIVPDGTATRAEAAAILMRFCENFAK